MCNFFTASDISIIVLGLCDVITDTASYRRCYLVFVSFCFWYQRLAERCVGTQLLQLEIRLPSLFSCSSQTWPWPHFGVAVCCSVLE